MGLSRSQKPRILGGPPWCGNTHYSEAPGDHGIPLTTRKGCGRLWRCNPMKLKPQARSALFKTSRWSHWWMVGWTCAKCSKIWKMEVSRKRAWMRSDSWGTEKVLLSVLGNSTSDSFGNVQVTAPCFFDQPEGTIRLQLPTVVDVPNLGD